LFSKLNKIGSLCDTATGRLEEVSGKSPLCDTDDYVKPMGLEIHLRFNFNHFYASHLLEIEPLSHVAILSVHIVKD
jgi:hypothetical protein